MRVDLRHLAVMKHRPLGGEGLTGWRALGGIAARRVGAENLWTGRVGAHDPMVAATAALPWRLFFQAYPRCAAGGGERTEQPNGRAVERGLLAADGRVGQMLAGLLRLLQRANDISAIPHTALPHLGRVELRRAQRFIIA